MGGHRLRGAARGRRNGHRVEGPAIAPVPDHDIGSLLGPGALRDVQVQVAVTVHVSGADGDTVGERPGVAQDVSIAPTQVDPELVRRDLDDVRSPVAIHVGHDGIDRLTLGDARGARHIHESPLLIAK